MTDSPSHAAAHVRFVLVNTSHPGNIGASARAIATMGFTRLCLVAPHAFPHSEATALAAGAADLLDAAVVSPDLGGAIADCRLVLGATARRRGVALPELDPREAAARILASATQGQQVAVLFGNERVGLENDEIMHCHAALTIPSAPACSSLNLAQAVQVVAWELRMAWLAQARAASIAGIAPLDPHGAARADPPASAAELDGFFDHLAQALDDIDFHKGRSPRTILRRLRRFFLRAQPDQRELHVLRGILADVIRTARIARGEG